MVSGSSPSYPPTPHLKRVMVFIDGGYFRKILQDYFGEDINSDPKRIAKPIELIANQINNPDMFPNIFPHSKIEILRIYYYDGLVQTDDTTYPEKIKFFKELRSNFSANCPLEIKFGRLIKGEDGKYRQKGVDVLLSIDMVVKAFQDHYDLSLLIAGDDDFVDAVKVVKDLTGKRIIGFIKPEVTSSRLIECFDYRFPNLPQPFFGGFKI